MKHDYKLIKKCAGMDKEKGQCKSPAILEETVRVNLFGKDKKPILDKDGKPTQKEITLWFCKFHFRAMVYQDTKRLVMIELANEESKKQLEEMREKQKQELIK